MSGLASAGTTIVLTLLAIATGAGLGRWWGGRHTQRRTLPVTGWPLVVAGSALAVLVELTNLPGGAALVVAAHALLLGACLLNLGRVGVPVVALGLVLVLAPTVIDGGMPVSRDALATMGWPSPPPDLPGARHVEVGRDRLTMLGGVVPLPVGGRPVSFGELILLAGLADVAFNAAAEGGARRARRLGVLRSVCAGTGASGAVSWSDAGLAALEDEGPTVVVLGPVPGPTARTRPDAARRGAPAAERRLVLAESPGGGPERDGPAA